jgi:hypothetical protein
VRGTVFEFDSRRLRVDGGIVRLSNSRGQRVYVAEGQQSYIEESSRRPVPPFEAGNTLLSPALPELASTGSTGGLQAPDIPPPPADLGVSVTWP